MASPSVLAGSNPFEVVLVVVGDATVLMVADISDSVLVGPRSVVGRADENMAVRVTEVTHMRVVVSSFAVVAVSAGSLARRREGVEYLMQPA